MTFAELILELEEIRDVVVWNEVADCKIPYDKREKIALEIDNIIDILNDDED